MVHHRHVHALATGVWHTEGALEAILTSLAYLVGPSNGHNHDRMKRKRSRDFAASQACPKSAKHARKLQQYTRNTEPCHLMHILEQYGLLISIVSNLTPKDLFSLAATSKTTYKAIFSGEASRLNLLHMMPCDGQGIAIRRAHHRKSPYSMAPTCVDYTACGSNITTRIVETNPCEECNQTTCDECRIHCVFQCIEQPPDNSDSDEHCSPCDSEASSDPDTSGDSNGPSDPPDLPTYSGFALLAPFEMGILTPAHLNILSDDDFTSPFHDQGFLDAPLESETHASMESIDDILDFDLGQGPLKLSNSSNQSHPSSVIKAFWEYAEERKIMACGDCWRRLHGNDQPECHCTLRERVLERWLCLRCFEVESRETREISNNQKHQLENGRGYLHCICGKRFTRNGCREGSRRVCLWCACMVREAEPNVRTGGPLPALAT